MRHGICRLIECISIAKLELTEKDFENIWIFMEDCIRLGIDEV